MLTKHFMEPSESASWQNKNPNQENRRAGILNKNPHKNNLAGLCDRDRIQTCNRLIRSQLLYSVELRDHFLFSIESSDRDRIQTCNRLIRSQLLYSVELRGHFYIL